MGRTGDDCQTRPGLAAKAQASQVDETNAANGRILARAPTSDKVLKLRYADSTINTGGSTCSDY